ncbi:sigma-70 family RNA polymerase sigma factor [Mycolicibacterium sp. XJ662]
MKASLRRTDEELAARFAREAEPLFDVLSRAARRLTRSHADADDLLQDTLLHAYSGFHTFEEGSNIRAWLFRILYNRWISTHRRKRSRPVEVSVDTFTDHDTVHRSAEDEVLDTLPDNDIKAALAALPQSFKEAIYYADIQGYTYAETAKLLNVPMGTVMSRVSRARHRLRTALATDEPCIA